jgi:toxin ParE1/3/4
MYKLIISKEADKDIDDITYYMIKELDNPIAASSFLDDIEKSYKKVIGNPYIYSVCNDTRLSKEDYRKIIIKNYLILYRIQEDLSSVFIIRVVYSGRNYTEML